MPFDKKMEIAVMLFELGFAEDSVSAALCHTATFASARSWLAKKRITPTPKSPKASRMPSNILKRRPSAAIEVGPTPSKERRMARDTVSGTPRDAGKMIFNDDTVMCAICCDDVPATVAVRLACRHGWYCGNCIKRDADAHLARGSTDIRCPECREPIQEHDFKKLLKREVVQKLHALSIKQAIAASANLRACPTPDCTFAVELDEGEVARLDKCPLCKKSSCLHCGAQPFHKGLTCEEYSKKHKQDATNHKLMQKWMVRTGTQQCPCCKAAISKECLVEQTSQRRECHKMMCLFCKTKFCFKCKEILTDTYTCDCASKIHGFINPVTRRRMEHKATHLQSESGRGSRGKRR